MAKLECKSSQKGVPSKWVTVEGVTDAQVHAFRALLDGHLEHGQPSTAVATAFVNLVETCPTANPSDLWHHVLYRHLLEDGWNDQKWKRVSGFALERALVKVFSPRLEQHG
ncbi:MAG TPA: hypothetical protein VHX68_10165, partial [Planctomycetaceae bacterium]|nr:hypothetical protein [Planctomycetaceae bacterium]